MPLWLIILGSALAGGLLVLHGFGKTKQVSSSMLDCYQVMLKEIRQRKEQKKRDSSSDRDGDE